MNDRTCSPGRLAFLAVLLSPSLALAVGEPVGALKSHEERILGFLTNRIRVDPAAADALLSEDGETPTGRPIPPASPPLEIVADLSAAARFQAEHIATSVGC